MSEAFADYQLAKHQFAKHHDSRFEPTDGADDDDAAADDDDDDDEGGKMNSCASQLLGKVENQG